MRKIVIMKKDFLDRSKGEYQFSEEQKNAIRAIDKKNTKSDYKNVNAIKKSLARKYGF